MEKNRKAIVLDRDGVINFDSDDYIKSPEEWIPIPGSLEAIAQLHNAGYSVFVATNQSGIGRGYYTLETLDLMHQKFSHLLSMHNGKIDGLVFCPHTPQDNCDCRKPKTGLLEQIEEIYGVDLTGQPFIGDSLKDIESATRFGCKGILVRTGKGEETLKQPSPLLKNIPVFSDLSNCVAFLLSNDTT